MLGKDIKLRALEPDDLSFLYIIENDVANWSVSETKIPFSKYMLKNYIEQSGQAIEKSGQFRFVIETKDNSAAIGLIDIFDFDPINRRLSLGIIINAAFRQKGYASQALELIENYAANELNAHQIYCEIQAGNQESISFFTKNNYKLNGTKKDWLLQKDKYSDVYFFQKFL